MATTPIVGNKDVSEIVLESGTNILKVTAAAPSFRLAESDKTVLSEGVSQGELAYEPNGDGETCTITGKGTMNGAIKINDKINDLWVTEIASNAFEGETTITGVEIPYTVKVIGEGAFKGSGLEYVTFADTDEILVFFKNAPGWLTPYACYNCASMGEEVYQTIKMVRLEEAGDDIYCVNIPLDTISISFNSGNDTERTQFNDVQYDFKNMPNALFTPVRFNSSKGEYIMTLQRFYAIPSSIYLHKKLPNALRIGVSAFQNCSALASVNIPRRATWIGAFAFKECINLATCVYTSYSWLTRIDREAFRYCASLTAAVLPDTVSETGDGCYRDCAALEAFRYGPALTVIAQRMFRDCTNLTNINIGGADMEPRLKKIGQEAFYRCKGLARKKNGDEGVSIIIPSSVEYIGKYAFGYIDTEPRSEDDDYPVYDPNVPSDCSCLLNFQDIYTWFVSTNTDPTDAKSMEFTNPSSDPYTAGSRYLYKYRDKYLHKLKKMLPPEVSLDGTTLIMTDNLGVAEQFYIYVNNNTDWTASINLKTLS